MSDMYIQDIPSKEVKVIGQPTVSIDATGLATSAKQDTIIGHIDGVEGLLTTIDADTGVLAGAVTLGKVQTEVTNTVPVSGTFWQATQPVSVASVPAHDVTNAGTFAVQVTSAPSTTVTATNLDIRDLAKAQDEVYSVLKTDAGVAYDARLVTVQNATIAVTQSGTWDEIGINDSGNSITVDGTVTASAQPGVDIGDVTINNASGAAAVNIQDGGNTITVDGTVSANATLSAETTKVIGTVNVSTGQTITDVPATSGGLSKFHLVGAATTNATNVKASAGQVYSITAFNVAATPAYLKFHNTAGTPTAGSGVTDTFLIPGNTSGAGIVLNVDKGIAFGTGIGISITGGIADADTTAIGASNVVVNIYYK